MELLQGRTLKELMDVHRFSVAEVVDLAKQVGEALAYAHGKGVVHRDVKPQNIWVTDRADGQRKYKLLDFGLAKVLTSSGFTEMAEQLGTAIYAAPEQLEGKVVDHRSDQYSLGVVLYELLAGVKPTGNVRPLNQHASGVSMKMSNAIHQAMEYSPDARHRSISAMMVELSDISVRGRALEVDLRLMSTLVSSSGDVSSTLPGRFPGQAGTRLSWFDKTAAWALILLQVLFAAIFVIAFLNKFLIF
jgi:serine/threonine protein kinase